MTQNKIIPFGELSALAAELKSKGKKIVLCHGCDDAVQQAFLRKFFHGEDCLLIASVPPHDVVGLAVSVDASIQGSLFFAH